MGAALFGYTKLYGQVPGGQAEYLRVPQAHFGPIKVPGGPAGRALRCTCRTCCPPPGRPSQYADVPEGGTVAVLGLGPIGQMCRPDRPPPGRDRVIGVDLVPERLEMARRHGIEIIDATTPTTSPDAVRQLTGGRGTDSVIDAVGMEAHGSPAPSSRRRSPG